MPSGGRNRIDWAREGKKIVLWAASQLPRHMWRRTNDGHPPGAEEAEDLAQDAIINALTRRDEWTDENGEDARKLFKIMKGRVTHRLARLAKSHENQNVHLQKIVDQNPNSHELSTEPNTGAQGIDSTVLMSAELSLFESQVRWRVQQIFPEDSEEIAALASIIDGATKPSEVALDLHVSTSEAANAIRRFRRKCKEELKDISIFYDPPNDRKPEEG